jgi:hypothetical protein
MARLPILKPREIAHVWKRWNLSKFVSAARINNIVMQMDDARPFRFTGAAMSRLFC